jgi:hypothetical protein
MGGFPRSRRISSYQLQILLGTADQTIGALAGGGRDGPFGGWTRHGPSRPGLRLIRRSKCAVSSKFTLARNDRRRRVQFRHEVADGSTYPRSTKTTSPVSSGRARAGESAGDSRAIHAHAIHAVATRHHGQSAQCPRPPSLAYPDEKLHIHPVGRRPRLLGSTSLNRGWAC